jgi:hypothetical protein
MCSKQVKCKDCESAKRTNERRLMLGQLVKNFFTLTLPSSFFFDEIIEGMEKEKINVMLGELCVKTESSGREKVDITAYDLQH